jgi:hypothetical protein
VTSRVTLLELLLLEELLLNGKRTGLSGFSVDREGVKRRFAVAGDRMVVEGSGATAVVLVLAGVFLFGLLFGPFGV